MTSATVHRIEHFQSVGCSLQDHGPFDHVLTSITASTGYDTDPPRISRQTVHSVLMTFDGADERFRKHPVHLGGGDGSGVLAGLGERVESRV